ncbi:palmitoyl-(protein) hydrolase [Aureococcus anophagefferens]|nr:palmitoyl-(protein) hydrolase [Aureococcus anophagefferens]
MLRPLCVVALCASFAAAAKVYPSALAHGMGDSCFNAGMKEITALVGKTLDTYATCVPTGATLAEDTNNGFFMTMNKSVGAFAAAGLLFQIDYYRDPLRVTSGAYKAHSELAAWNNEGNVVNETYKRNFVSVDKWIMVKAEKDTMIHPNEGEHWGAFADGSLKKVLPMRETPWYVEDLFGLKTVDERGGIFFNATAGDHMQFTKEELVAWLVAFWRRSDDATVVPSSPAAAALASSSSSSSKHAPPRRGVDDLKAARRAARARADEVEEVVAVRAVERERGSGQRPPLISWRR